ncbi:hypothetical protein LCM20_09895 [Halobacillus litoralis]|uniref:hypothetical protein n=1 Tax=Halobacillus litoralis TaxID=45668 RepID=UPI001CD63209|nr:hypothetical protein [Halobacillus litoralis]MCA0970902.1 hypothetical protein [Halobacillus litoralis]
MEQNELTRLRKKQLILLNVYAIIVFLSSWLLIYQVSGRTIYALLALFCAGFIATETYGLSTGRYLISKDMKKLITYEKAQIGERRWEKEKRTAIITQVFVLLLVAFQYFMTEKGEPFFPTEVGWLFGPFALFLVLIMNAGTISRMKRVDAGQTNFTKKTRMTVLLTGILLVLTSITISFFVIFAA